MKSSNTILGNAWRAIVPVLLMAMAIGFNSCKKDEALKPAPTVSVNPATASNTAGSKATASVQVDSPEGGSILSILVNGAANSSLPDVALDGSPSQSVSIEFTIPASATVGAIYTITFQASDMKGQLSALGTFVVTVSAVPAKQIVDVTTAITADATWTSDKIYRLNGFIRVGEDVLVGGTPVITAGKTATLTIQAGTVIYGKKGSPGGTLIIHRGSKLIANGTSSNPIVFTSDQAIGSKKSGDWGGIVLCGKADINQTGSGFATHTAELEGAYGGYYGGGPTADDADNSGSISYVRIEFAGYPINPNQELNGLTMGGVGSGTTVQYVQVTYSNDDSFEWFGGKVNASNLIAYKTLDDDFDTDFGYRGNVQFGLAIRDALVSDQSGSNGFESDNDANGTAALPNTAPTFSNITIIGPKASSGITIGTQFQNGAHLRRGTQIKLINSFITAFPTGIYVDGTAGAAITNAGNGSLLLRKNILAGVTGWGGNGFGTATNADETATISGLPFSPNSNFAAPPRGRVVAVGTIPSGSNPFVNGVFTVTDVQVSGQNGLPWFAATNTVVKSHTDTGLNANVFEPLGGTPTLLPTPGSLLLTTVPDFTGFTGVAGITTTGVNYIGAFGATDWTTGWVNWNPQLKDYSF